MATYSHAWRAMNSSVPGAVSPPLIEAAATRMPTITATIAQNSVVLNACFVSVERRRTRSRPAVRSVLAPTLPARLVADSICIPPRWDWCSSQVGPPGRDGGALGLWKALSEKSPRDWCVPGDPLGAGFGYPAKGTTNPPGEGRLMEAPRFELGSADAVRGCLQV